MRSSVRHLVIPGLLAIMFVVAACGSSGSSLTGKNWKWTASTTTAPASQSVVPPDQQANYTIEFKSDGTFAAKSDCNQVAGNYTTGANNALTIVPGPSTLVACPEGSLADLYIAGLAATQSYAITDNQLVLTTSDGTMTFD
jgi:heat shock protein HslJ